jgi:peptide deformylase
MELRVYPDRVLRRKCRPIELVDERVVGRAEGMLEFMYEADGVGLAAPQVGLSEQLVTLDVEQQRAGERVFVNPRIIEREGHQEQDEGCLSLPGLRAVVSRAERVLVVAYTLGGERVEIEAEGLAARAWQHEVDHLNGILFIDRLPPTTLMTLRDQLKRLEKQGTADLRQ